MRGPQAAAAVTETCSKFQIHRFHSLRQHLDVLVLRNVDCAEGLQMLRGELRVEEGEALRPQSLDQMDEADLRRIGPSGKHALAKEGRAERHAVEPAHQLVA